MRRPKRRANVRDINETDDKPKRPVDPERSRTRTLQRAVKLLAAKPRSVAELRERLLEKEWTTEEAADYAIAKLSEYGYVNDEQFALGYASARVRQKPVGRQQLARDLQMKQIDRELAEETLKKVFEATPEAELIDAAIEKRVRLRGRPTTRQETKSLFDHLLRRGFSYDLIIGKVRALSSAELSDDEEDASSDADD
ncbi:MAG: recombination regulator RecX [Acidobacteria bacterium]|nr:recombination regulator RecX [Acidobacteriota bacterium]